MLVRGTISEDCKAISKIWWDLEMKQKIPSLIISNSLEHNENIGGFLFILKN